MRCACIDIGSNTTRLLVAEHDPARPGRLREIAAQRTFVRLTARERLQGVPPEKAEAIAEAVAAQAQAARDHGATALRVVATAALRDAPGRAALLERLQAAAGAEVEILSGAQEARLAFAGATAGRDPASTATTVLVADVGGGSTELAAGPPGGPLRWWASLPIGSGVLADEHLTGDPPTAAQLAAARASARAALHAADCPPAQVAWVVGGSATSLHRLCGAQLTPQALDRALDRLCARPASIAAMELDLHAERVRLLPAALVLLSEVARAASCSLEVADGGLREGVVLDLLGEVE